MAGDHLWVNTSASGDFCYVGDSDCTVCIHWEDSSGYLAVRHGLLLNPTLWRFWPYAK